MPFDPKSALKELDKPKGFDPVSALSEIEPKREELPLEDVIQALGGFGKTFGGADPGIPIAQADAGTISGLLKPTTPSGIPEVAPVDIENILFGQRKERREREQIETILADQTDLEAVLTGFTTGLGKSLTMGFGDISPIAEATGDPNFEGIGQLLGMAPGLMVTGGATAVAGRAIAVTKGGAKLAELISKTPTLKNIIHEAVSFGLFEGARQPEGEAGIALEKRLKQSLHGAGLGASFAAVLSPLRQLIRETRAKPEILADAKAQPLEVPFAEELAGVREKPIRKVKDGIDLQMRKRGKAEPEKLSKVPSAKHEKVAQGKPVKLTTEEKGYLSELRQRISKAGEINKAKLSELRRFQDSNAPSRLSKTIGSNMVMSKLPSKVARETRLKPQALEVPRKLDVSIERELKTAKGEIDLKSKPQDIQGITDKLSKNLGVPIRIGRFRKVTAFGKVKRAGIFKPDAKVARTGSADDLPTITHEVAHFIDDKFKVQRLIKKDKAFADELSQLDYDPTKGRTTEGFAEFVRLWMTDDVAAEVAPKFNKKFGEFLAENPDLKKTLESARDDIFRFRKQGAEARVRSSLTLKGQKDFGGLADAYLKARTAFSDALAPLRELDIQAEKILGRKLLPEESAFQTATAINKTAPMKARQWAEVATADFDGNPTGLSMKAILEPVKGRELKAIEYAYSKHALERWGKGKNPGVARTDAKVFIEKNKSPKFETFSKELSAYRDRLLQYVVDSGGLSEETASIFREYYKSSIPLYRTGFAGHGIGKGKGFADLGKPIKGAKGSGRKVINPLAGLLSETERLISWADRARIGQLIVDTAEKAGGLGKWIEKVDIPAKPKKVLIEDIKAQFEKMGGDLTELNLDDFNKYMTFWTSEARGIPKENIVTFYRDGKLQAFQLHPELFKAVKSVDQVILPTWLRLFTLPKKVITAGATGLRASFGLGTNAIRDPMTYFMQSENPAANPFKPLMGDYVQARSKLGLLLKYDTPKEARLWMQQGGEMAMFFNSELPKAMKTAQSMIREGRTPAGWGKETIKGVGTVYRETINVPEAGARITEFTDIYNKTLKETGSRRSAWIAGQIAAKDVTINFTRMGNIVALGNQFIPFLNPAIQGVGKLGRTFKANPMRTIARGSVLTAATLSLWWKNRNEDWYQALPAWDKYGFWHFKVDNTIWRLPRPFEWGYIFAGMPEGAAESMMQNNPDEFKKSMGEALENALPPLMPGFLGPSLQVGIGEGGFDFFRDRPIVPQAQVERLAPSERAGRFTTETSKEIGRLLNVSPRKVDFWIGAQTGGMGQDIIRFVESISRPGLSAKTISDIPFIGRFTSRTPFVGKLYEELRDARKKEINLPGATRKEKARGGDKARAIVVKAKQLERIAKRLALWRKAIDGIERDTEMSTEDKKKKVQKLESQMEQLAKKAIFSNGGN